MNALFVSLAILATMLVAVQAKECDEFSQRVASVLGSNNEAAVKFIEQNCPTYEVTKAYGLISMARESDGVNFDGLQKTFNTFFAKVYGNQKLTRPNYRVYSEQVPEQREWKDEVDKAINQYYSELADVVATGEGEAQAVEYPPLGNLKELIDQFEDDNVEYKHLMHSNNFFVHHSKDQGMKKLAEALKSKGLYDDVFWGIYMLFE